jgi:hypothetical protein
MLLHAAIRRDNTVEQDTQHGAPGMGRCLMQTGHTYGSSGEHAAKGFAPLAGDVEL